MLLAEVKKLKDNIEVAFLDVTLLRVSAIVTEETGD